MTAPRGQHQRKVVCSGYAAPPTFRLEKKKNDLLNVRLVSEKFDFILDISSLRVNKGIFDFHELRSV